MNATNRTASILADFRRASADVERYAAAYAAAPTPEAMRNLTEAVGDVASLGERVRVAAVLDGADVVLAILAA